jgi:hypothetical protein
VSDATPHAPAHEPAASPDAGHDSHDDTGAHDAGGHAGHAGAVALGPIDWRAWGAGVVGVAAGAIVVASLYLATAPR